MARGVSVIAAECDRMALRLPTDEHDPRDACTVLRREEPEPLSSSDFSQNVRLYRLTREAWEGGHLHVDNVSRVLGLTTEATADLLNDWTWQAEHGM